MYSQLHVYRDSNVVIDTFPFYTDSVRIIGGNALNTLYAHIYVMDAATASSTTTCTVTVQHSDDNSTWYDYDSGAAYTFTFSTTAVDKAFSRPFATEKEYTRIKIATASGTDPEMKVKAFQALERLV